MNKYFSILKEPRRILSIVWRHLGFYLPDKFYLEILYGILMRKKLNLKNPKTFSEKLQWLKLYDRRPEYVKMVDKAAVKDYVAGIIGDEYIIPTLGVWDRPEDIDWDSLPDQFVLKCTHDSGGLVICRDKAKLDKAAAMKKLRKSLKQNYYKVWREWPYKDVPRRIIAEKYIEPAPDLKDLPDYKFFCFDGEVKALFVATDRQKPGEDVKFDFFDADFNHLPFKQGHEHAAVTPPKPENFELMKKAATQLSKGMPHARVDLYEVGDKILFGEVTLFHFSGLVPFRPDEWDKVFGDMLTLAGARVGGGLIRLIDNGEMVVSRPDLPDYKFFCFNGEPKYCQVISGRNETMCIDFFDMDWVHQPFHEPKNYPFAEVEPARPALFDKMRNASRLLAQGKVFSRIDFYQVRDLVLFGEITFYPTSGMGGFMPEVFDTVLGQMITLPG